MPDKPTKDWWDKADSVTKWAAALITPAVVALIGWWVQDVVTTQNTGKDYIGIALGILERKDLPEDMQKNRGLREWAVKLLNRYSAEKLDGHTTQELISGETRIPLAETPESERIVADFVNPDLSLHVVLYANGVANIVPSNIKNGGKMMTVTSGISPTAGVFSPDNHHLALYGPYMFEILDIDYTTDSFTWVARNVRAYSGIQSLRFADNNVIIKGIDNKETEYTLTGQKITQ